MSVEVKVIDVVEGMKVNDFEDPGSELTGLLSRAKFGNEIMMQKSISLIKEYLENKTLDLEALLKGGEGGNDFLFALVKCLKSKNISSQLDAISVLNYVINNEASPSQKGQVLGSKSDVIPTLIKVLKSDEKNVCGAALQTLALISDEKEFATKLQRTDLIVALLKVAKKKNCHPHLLQCVAKVAFTFCEIFDNSSINATDKPRRKSERKLKKTGASGYGSSNVFPIYKIVELCSVLLKLKDNTIAKFCMGIIEDSNLILREQERFKATISGGLVPMMASQLKHPDPELKAVASMALCSIADTRSKDRMLEFFQALKGTDGMKNFHSCVFQTSLVMKPEDTQLVSEFFLLVRKTLQCDNLRTAMVEAVINCGFHQTLIHCLESETTPNCILENGLFLLELVTNEKKLHIIKPILDGGVIPLLVQLLNVKGDGDEDNRSYKICLYAILVIRNILTVKSKCWEELMRLGGLRTMLGYLQTPNTQMQVCAAIVSCLDVMLGSSYFSKVPFESLMDLLPGLECVQERLITFDDVEIGSRIKARTLDCISNFGKSYGNPAYDLLLKRGWFERVVKSLTTTNYSPASVVGDDVQLSALQGVVYSCFGVDEYRDILLKKLEILEYFPPLFQNPTNRVRLGAMSCLTVLLFGNKLDQRQFSLIETMMPFVETEVMKGPLENKVAAKVLLKKIDRYRKLYKK